MDNLEKALKYYEDKNFNKSFELFKTVRKELGDEEFDKIYSFKFSRSVYEALLRNANELNKESQPWIVYIIQKLKNRDLFYKLTIFKVCDLLSKGYNTDYTKIIKWISKLDKELLSDKISESEKDGKKIQYSSEKEKYYNIISKAYEKSGDFEKAMEISIEALEVLPQFTSDSDVWFKRRIAEHYVKEEKYQDALLIYKEILKRKNDWFILKEIAEIYLKLGDKQESKKHILDAILGYGEPGLKINLFMEFYENSKKDEMFDSELGLEALKVYFKIKIDNGWKFTTKDREIGETHTIDVNEGKFSEINIKEFQNRCKKIRWEEESVYSGTVDNVSEKFFFVKLENGEKCYCKYKDYPNRKKPIQGTKLNFNIIETFDSKKNRYTKSAVNLALGV